MAPHSKFVLAASVLVAFAVNAADEVVVNLDVRHSVNGVSEFDRSRFMLVHAGLNENDWDSNQMRQSFLEEYDVYLGRNNGALPWFLSQTTEHASKSGWIDHISLESQGDRVKSNYSTSTAAHALEGRVANHMIGGQMNMYPNGQQNGDGFALGSYEAFADYIDGFLSYFYGEGGVTGEPKPAMVEVVNEPFVKANQYSTTKQNIAELHNVVADKVKVSHPDVMVGGYTAAHPAFEAADFALWENNWKMFIDVAGEKMDFFSTHLYDYLAPEDHFDPTKTQYRSGSNVEAILDMIEHYSMLTLGEVKPFAISEFGSFEPIEGNEPWSPETNWSDVRSFSSILMQLMERPDRMLQAMPFVVLKAEWGRSQQTGHPYGPRLLRQRFEDPNDSGNEWVYSELILFYELWKNVNGIRIDTTSEDQDVQVDAYVDGKKLYLILNNLELEAKPVDLRFVSKVLNPVVSVHSKETYAEDGVPKLRAIEYSNYPTSLTVEANATMIIEYEFAEDLVIDESSEESKHYATSYLKPIVADQRIDFEINGVTIPEHGEAVLRIGMGRAHGRSLSPILLVNGEAVPVPSDWRGYDQSTRSSFFGVIEISVPKALLQENNTISLEYPDSSGHVSSVCMQVWAFSSAVRDTEISAMQTFDYEYDGDRELFEVRTFGEIGKEYTVIESTNLSDWAVAGESKPGEWRWVEFEVDGSENKFLKLIESDREQPE
ncbi:hypothetical protein [Pelagicoccus mobilis]|uniref:Beta-agarase n=1 Tax=Pelagicoccus mobilis TaxID=415221 RepID=A0A934RWW9_9BACT|nr:hypothetical protein [Pelagicoccus mobilis]MBK1876990.1 hypothetical protein [Pelagicoccus mobilis]